PVSFWLFGPVLVFLLDPRFQTLPGTCTLRSLAQSTVWSSSNTLRLSLNTNYGAIYHLVQRALHFTDVTTAAQPKESIVEGPVVGEGPVAKAKHCRFRKPEPASYPLFRPRSGTRSGLDSRLGLHKYKHDSEFEGGHDIGAIVCEVDAAESLIVRGIERGICPDRLHKPWLQNGSDSLRCADHDFARGLLVRMTRPRGSLPVSGRQTPHSRLWDECSARLSPSRYSRQVQA
ncbi:uncharacterized protein B0H64DRAFT_131819, partial [Chaetomium fimeti]